MPTYIRLTGYKSSEDKDRGFFMPENRYKAKQEDFEKIPGSPIAYWVSDKVLKAFEDNKTINEIATLRQGMATSDNNRFLRFWNEISINDIGFGIHSRELAKESMIRWFPYNKGGSVRKWYGNNEYVVNYYNDGDEIKKTVSKKYPYLNGNTDFVVKNQDFYFKESATWSATTNGLFSVRYSPQGFVFDAKGQSVFSDNDLKFILSYLNTKIVSSLLELLTPTLDFNLWYLNKLPIIFPKSPEVKQKIDQLAQQNIDISKEEWDSRETSWDFRINELIRMKNEVLKAQNCRLEDAYNAYCDYWREKFFQLHANEEELNRLFIEIYGLQDELTPDVSLEDITILKNEAKIEGGELVFQKDEIVKQLISYGVGVMFGRYSLDHEGLHIADMGVSLEEANERFGIDHPTFEADDDNIIPVLEDDYFDDDIVGRFREFLKAAFGEEYLEENIRFVEEALGKSLRKYFVKDFYEDHIKRYKKRPIYWMVSSPKHAFNALFYMHRYRPDIFARIQTGYLHEYMAKLEAKLADARRVALDESSSAKERKEAQKEITRIEKALKELRAFDNEALSHYAAQSEPIDLDDGVKVNYCRFKEILWPIKGLCK